MGEAPRSIVTASEEISIPCWTIALFRPQLEEQRVFQNEIVAVTGAAHPEENALKPYIRGFVVVLLQQCHTHET
jgi:hypothetical protein